MSKEIYGYINQDYVDSMNSIYSVFNADSLTDEELNRCRDIARQIINFSKYNENISGYYHNTSHERAISESIDYLYTFGDIKIAKNASNILNSISKEVTSEENPCFFELFSSLEYSPTLGYYKFPQKMFLPAKVSDYSSFFITHELAHGLKDNYSQENQTIKTLEEVVPILVELITAYEHNDIRLFKNVCASRINLMFNNSVNYIDAYNKYNSCNNDLKPLYRFALEENACYLNSFYYVMSLFNMYLDNNELVISLVSQVLLGKLTTKDLISTLNADNNKLYCNGFGIIKRYI